MVTVCGMMSFLLTTSIVYDNINVLDLALWAEKILYNLKKMHTLCIHCGQLILMKISKIGATRCQMSRVKCTKFDFRWGSAPDPAGRAYSAPPDHLAVFIGPTSKGKGGKEGGRGGEGERKGKGGGLEPPHFALVQIVHTLYVLQIRYGVTTGGPAGTWRDRCVSVFFWVRGSVRLSMCGKITQNGPI